MERIMFPRATRKLAERAPIPVDPSRSIAIKRDVHSFEIEADAATFAAAFRDVVTDPESSFGLIRVKRPAERMGRPFELGERFQGCFSIERGVIEWIERSRWLRFLRRPVAAVLGAWPFRSIVVRIEDEMLSDYGEIVELSTQRLRYRYLDGTPIRGSSTFVVEPLGERRCRFTQVFEFQEVNGIALRTFERFGLKYHDQVVAMQVRKAAARAGARVLSGTIPEAYGGVSGAESEGAGTSCGAPSPRPSPRGGEGGSRVALAGAGAAGNGGRP